MKKKSRCRDYTQKGNPGSHDDMLSCIHHGETISKECVPGKWYNSPDPCRNRVSSFGDIMNSRVYDMHLQNTKRHNAARAPHVPLVAHKDVISPPELPTATDLRREAASFPYGAPGAPSAPSAMRFGFSKEYADRKPVSNEEFKKARAAMQLVVRPKDEGDEDDEDDEDDKLFYDAKEVEGGGKNNKKRKHTKKRKKNNYTKKRKKNNYTKKRKTC